MRRLIVAFVGVAAVGSLVVVPPGRAASPEVGCDWPVTLGYEGVNLLGPDTAANYWLLSYVAVPGARLRIDGRYPDARYFSLTVQDAAQITLGSLRDEHLEPNAGEVNPFRNRRARPATGTYTAFIDFGARPAPPATPAANTFYAGRTLEGEPNPGGTLVYRVYVPTDGDDRTGGVGLPRVTLEGAAVELQFARCDALPPDVGGPGNDVTNTGDRPAVLPNPAPLNRDYDRPDFVRIHSGQFTDPVVNSLPDGIRSAVPRRKGVPLANADFPYLRSNITRAKGEVVVVRFRAPTFPDTARGQSVVGRHETRYWSLCNHSAVEESGLRTTGCLTDHLTPADRHGWVRVVVSDPAHRPDAVIVPAAGVHWLPWGVYNNDMMLYRVGIPRADWRYSPLGVSPDAPDQAAAARAAMGDYYPDAVYCSKAQIEAGGVDSCYDT